MKRYLRPGWFVLYLVVLLGWASWYVPRISAERYRETILRGLETELGRKVSFGTLKFRLLPVPGFTISDLIIGEDPAIGPEPAAYVTTLRGRPRLSALFGGPLEFASIDLEETSVNLTRAEGDATSVRWNFSSLTRTQLKTSFPTIHMIGGRVNFKFGDTKTVFYLLNTDADMWPPTAEGGPWTLKVRAEPARTDRPSRGFGSFVARGEWRPRDGAITIDVKLEKSELSDIGTLFRGSESGLHGHIWGEAHLAGPANRVGLAGRLNIDDIHGWNQPPTPGSKAFPVVLSGALDVQNQVFDIRATSGVAQVPIDLRYRVQNFLGRPRWALTALFDGTPLAPVADVARHVGWAVGEDLAVTGTARGVLGYSIGPDSDVPRFNGGVRFTGMTATPRGGTGMKVADTSLTVDGTRATLEPATITASSGETALLDGAWDTAQASFSFGLSTTGMAVETLRPVLAGTGVPFLGQLAGGHWKGSVRRGGDPVAWTGDVHIQDASLRFDAFAEPLQIVRADAQLDAGGTTIRNLSIKVAGLEAEGDYRYEQMAAVPHQFHVAARDVDGAVLEKLLAPALNRASLLNKTLNFGKVPTPDWLRDLRAAGTFQLTGLALGPLTLSNVKTRLESKGETATLAGFTAQHGKAAVNGELLVNLAGAQPRYEFTGKVSGIPWRTGTFELDGVVQTSGSGTDLLSKASARGGFSARGIDAVAGNQFSTATGQFELNWANGDPRLTVSTLAATGAGVLWSGTVEPRDKGAVRLRLTSGDKTLEADGAVFRGELLAPTASGR